MLDDSPPRPQPEGSEQWRSCEWWRASGTQVPIITVEDLLSYRSRCFVLDVRAIEDFESCHFQSSVHIREPEAPELLPALPPELLAQCRTEEEEPAARRWPWGRL